MQNWPPASQGCRRKAVFGTKRTNRAGLLMSAFEGEAEVVFWARQGSFSPNSDMDPLPAP